MKGAWYTFKGKVVCDNCARHIAGQWVQGEGDPPCRCEICGGKKVQRPATSRSRRQRS